MAKQLSCTSNFDVPYQSTCCSAGFLGFLASSLLKSQGKKWKAAQGLGYFHLLGDLDRIPGFWLKPDTALATVANWRSEHSVFKINI